MIDASYGLVEKTVEKIAAWLDAYAEKYSQNRNLGPFAAELAEGVRAGEWRSAEPAAATEPTPPTCSACGDTHRMPFCDVVVMCTRCPLPCLECQDGYRPYCRRTPCECACHAPKKG